MAEELKCSECYSCLSDNPLDGENWCASCEEHVTPAPTRDEFELAVIKLKAAVAKIEFCEAELKKAHAEQQARFQDYKDTLARYSESVGIPRRELISLKF